MVGNCNLEVEVNGQETFMVNMKTIASYSRRFGKLSGGTETGRKMKVILHDFPGGAESFERIVRFCYNNGRIQNITPHNILLLNAAAHYMEMDQNVLEGISCSCWSWSELLEASIVLSSRMVVDEVIVDNLVQRLFSYTIGTLSTSSSTSDSLGYRLSTDSRKTDSLSCYGSASVIWWFEDLVFLSVDWIEVIVKKTVLMKFDHSVICRFLVYYKKSRFLGAEVTEKRKILESMINLFLQLDSSSVSCKCLFRLLRLCSVSKTSNKTITTIESLIGSKLDQAIIDQLLVPSPTKEKYAYDVNLVLRIVEAFLRNSSGLSSLDRLRKVGFLMDSYLEEVGPDFNLNPFKFEELVMILPTDARHCHDRLYRSIDLYFETHRKLCEDDRLRICSVVNYGKLSADVGKHFGRNSRFPASFRASAMAKCKKGETVRAYVSKIEKMVVTTEKAYKSTIISSPRHDRYFPMLCSI